MHVRDLMSPTVQTCHTTDTLNTAAALMWHHATGMVTVLDEQDHPVAVITDRELAMASFITGQRLSEIPISQSMSKALFTCQASDTLQAAQAHMAAHHVRRLPVLDAEGALCGILSTSDLIRAAASGWRLFAAPELVRALRAVTYPSMEMTDSTTAEGSFKEWWQGGMTLLESRRDAMRLKLHLASMDAREEWEGLEKRLNTLKQKAQRTEQRAEGDIQRALDDLSEGYKRLRERLSPDTPTPSGETPPQGANQLPTPAS